MLRADASLINMGRPALRNTIDREHEYQQATVYNPGFMWTSLFLLGLTLQVPPAWSRGPLLLGPVRRSERTSFSNRSARGAWERSGALAMRGSTSQRTEHDS